MLYIIGLTRENQKSSKTIGRILNYELFDTDSESCIRANEKMLKSILSDHKIEVANAEMNNNEIKIQDWVNKITIKLATLISTDYLQINGNIDLCSSILLAKEAHMYKMVDNEGFVTKISANQLKSLVRLNKVANCIRGEHNGKSTIIESNTYKIVKDAEFEKSIKIKYEGFIAKASLLGYEDVSFNYEIENKQVKLRKYTGTSKKVILPSFITTIMTKALSGRNLETIELNEGLEIIGQEAFDRQWVPGGPEKIEIPSTVKWVGTKAFAYNTKLLKQDGSPHTNRIIIRNKATLLMDQFYYKE